MKAGPESRCWNTGRALDRTAEVRPVNDATSKTCTQCRESLPLSAFGRSARSSDGLRSQCLECNAARVRKAYTFAEPPGVIVCQWCGTEKLTRNSRTRYCSDQCKHRAAEDRRSAKAASAPPRACRKCGAPVTTRVGYPVCAGCRVDPRDASERDRRRTLRKYGLTEQDWAMLLAAQGGRCAICRTDTPGGRGERWHIDHCHEAGTVRGLLCHNCNVGLGNFKDDPSLLIAAADYLKARRIRRDAAV